MKPNDLSGDQISYLKALRRQTGGGRLDPESCLLSTYRTGGDPEQARVVDRVAHYADHLEQNVNGGRSLLFFGRPGTGKDHLAIALARAVILRMGLSATWVSMCEMKADIRNSIHRGQTEVPDRLLRCGFLVLSDPVALGGHLTDFQAEVLHRIVDYRWRTNSPTVVTCNCRSLGECAELMGSQVVDRLVGDGEALEFSWTSFRGQYQE